MRANVPRLTGIFVSLWSGDYKYGAAEWDREFAAMAAVGISFVGVRAALVGSSSRTTGGCVLGTYTAFYKTSLEPAACYSVQSGDTLDHLLKAASTHGIKVHVTPAMPHTPFAWPPTPSTQPNKTMDTYFDQLTHLQATAFAELWDRFPQHHDTIAGVYTGLEEWNGPGWMKPEVSASMAPRYLEALSKAVRTYSGKSELEVWASPYYVGNATLHPTAQSASDYASYWQSIWALAPSFDWIALQDSRGWMGNTDAEVAEVLTALGQAAAAAGRQLWSNVELFEGWPLPCEFPVPCGRHPAPIDRIVAQLANESPLVEGRHIAWEWTSCLSPYTNNATAALYNDYVSYLSAAEPEVGHRE